MRPHSLEITAFGPFPGTVQVDLAQLAGGGLFLLHGETGAGKTTILDAIGYALYGRIPGERGKVKRLRSDHASPGERTQVRLDVTLGGRRLRITRSPEQVRAKRRGTGVTTEPGKVLLEEYDGDRWVPLSTRHDEAGDEIAARMGMSAEQFFQVVLLPQNDFARFLRASSEERGDLLERLFGTARFGFVEKTLAGRRRAALSAVDTALAAVDRTRAMLAQAARVEPPEGEVDPGWAAELAARCRAEAEFAGAELLVREAMLAEAHGTAAEVQALADRQQRRLVALARQAAADVTAPEIQRLCDEVRRAARAAEVAGSIEEAGRRQRARSMADDWAATTRIELPALGVDPSLDEPGLLAVLDGLRGRITRLESLRAVAETAAAEEAAAAAAAADAAASEPRLAACEASLADVPRHRAAAVRELAEARAAAMERPRAEAVVSDLRAARDAAAALGTATAAAEQLAEQLLTLREQAVDDRERAVELRATRVDGMIAELAASLTDGDPCPVCGALEHPDPSEVRGTPLSRQEEEAAFATAERTARRVAETEAELAALRASAAAATVRLAETGYAGADPAGLSAVLAAAEETVAALGVLAAGLANAEQRCAAVDRQESELAAERAGLVEQVRALQASASENAGRAARAQATVDAELHGAPDLESAAAAAGDAVELLEAAIEAAADAARAAAESTRAERAAAAAVTAVGFATVEEARAATRSPAWRESAQARIDGHAAEVAAVRAALADPDLAVDCEPLADRDAAEAALVAAQATLGEAQRRHSVALERATAVSTLVPQLDAALAGLVPLRERAAEIRGIADLVNGQGSNALRMTLTSYVLAARLEEVAAAASERLLRMSQGRYALVHTDAGRGGGRAGLGLLARDSWTGQDRDTATLSGGETFLASLALALGLSDVVTEEAGGAPIEALFVDEGFGTLDEQTLDEVMDVLDGLREGGRMVGVVSHVPELLARIPSRVSVHKGRHGSDLTVVGCA